MSDCPHQHLKDTGIDRLRDIVREHTDDGLKIVRFLVKAMDGEFQNYKPHHNIAAAKELLSRGWAFPNAVECAWYRGHHVPASYFNSHKVQNGHNTSTQPSEDAGPSASAVKADTASTVLKAAPATTTAKATATTAIEARSELVEADSPRESTKASPEPSRKTGFTEFDSFPEYYWASVLELCERLEQKGTIPRLPLGPDDPLPIYAPSR